MNQDRRSFLKNAAFAALAAEAATGCKGLGCAGGASASMLGFAAPKLDRVRIGFVGVGNRGTYAVKRIAIIPGAEISAICDINEKQLKVNRDFLAEKKLPPAREYSGAEGWKKLCEDPDIDVVYAAAPWELHAPVCIYAMKCGKHAMVEVPAAMFIDDLWEIVETSEKTRRHCMMLENCCYGENELLALNLVRTGKLGETVYGEAGYQHDCRYFFKHDRDEAWRMDWYTKHCGNIYPTHGLGPVAQYMNINRGDRFDFAVSVEAKGSSIPAYTRANFPEGSWQRGMRFKKGDINTSIVRTANGQVIMLSYTTSLPHPYSRLNAIQGTKGIFLDYPLRIAYSEKYEDVGRNFSDENTQRIRQESMHPLWKQVGEIAKKVGGHGGMDFVMDLRWIYCLRNGLPLDMDVYDLAAWSSLCEVTERSVLNGSRPEPIPDFTRGAWKTAAPLGVVTMDLEKAGFSNISVDGNSKQQTI